MTCTVTPGAMTLPAYVLVGPWTKTRWSALAAVMFSAWLADVRPEAATVMVGLPALTSP